MSNSTLTGRTFSATNVSDVVKRLDRIDVKDVKRTAQLAAIMIDLAYSVSAWRDNGVTVKDTSRRLASLRGETGARAELRAAMPNTGDKVQAAMINIARIVRLGHSEIDHDNLEMIKVIIADANYLMAGKAHRMIKVDDLAEIAGSCLSLAEFAATLADRRKTAETAIEADKLIKDEEVDQAPVQDQLPATPQELINNAASILNADILRNCEDDLELDVIAQLLTGIIRQNKIVKARSAASVAA